MPLQKLSSVCTIIGGFAFKSKLMKADKGKYQIIKMSNLYKGVLDLSRNSSYIDNIEPNQEQYLLKKGDILLTLTGTVGKRDYGYSVMICDQKNLLLNQRLCMLRPEPNTVNSYFLLQILKSKRFLNLFFGSSIGGTGNQANVSINALKEIKFDIPPLYDQTAIANLLSTWDTAIEKIERLIAAKEKRFKALFQRLIHAPSQIKDHWKHLKICDIAKRIQRRSYGDDLPILTISSAYGFVLQEEKYSRYMAGESVKNYIRLRKGEFAYNKGNSLRYQFGCIFELKDYKEALVPHVYVCFKPNADVDSGYLGHLFEADYLRRQLGAIVKTGVRNNGLLNIKPDEFMNVTVPVPPLDQQKQIADTLKTAHSEINLLKKQLDAYRRQKRGLMQKLLTGQWRVKVKEN